MKHPIRRRLIYLGFQGLRAFIQSLPLSAARALGRALASIAYLVLGAQRRLTIQHMEYAFGPSLRQAQRRLLARGVFCNLGQNLAEWLLLPTLSSRDLEALITSEGIPHLREALAKGNGVIMLTAHFGNWELIPLYLRSLGFEGGVLARRLRYPEYESFLITMRGAQGIPTFARGSLREVATLLRANQIIGMLPDQDVESLEGVFVNFFGHPAYTPIGPAALSLMTGAPILPSFVIREGSRFRLVIEPAVQVLPAADRTETMTRLTQAWSDIVESYIRRYPDHWAWMHRRWKTKPATSHQPPATSSAFHRLPEDGLKAPQPAVVPLILVAYGLSLVAGVGGCAKHPSASRRAMAQDESAAPVTSPAATNAQSAGAQQAMSGFTLTGYQEHGAKQWELHGEGASLDGQVVTILRPDAVGYDPMRTAYLTASVAQVNQANRHVRLEHNVTIHTSDGVWFASPALHWIPDQDQMATDAPVRIETDHMLLRGRGAQGFTQLKQATIFEDIELVLNPSDHDQPGGGRKQVTITCDGPLAFDYEHYVATFEQNVHVQDPTGDLYSDKLVAYLDDKTHTIRYAEATGRVRIHQHQNTALSERAIYEPAIGKITLVGKPSLLVYPSGGTPGTQLSFGALAASPQAPPPPAAPSARGTPALELKPMRLETTGHAPTHLERADATTD